jgi:hypothetical protein
MHFEQAITGYWALSTEQKLKFDNAAFWLQHSTKVYRESRSAAYVAIAIAIESVMPPPERGKQCECCKLHIGKGPTAQFKDFITQFVPAPALNGKQISRLYEVRSKLAHGHDLLIEDQEILAPALESFEDWQDHDIIQRLARIALMNWLNHTPSRDQQKDQS